MNIQLIRNATLKIEYAGKTILVDPMLSAKGAFESFAGIAQNPIVDLPLAVDQILDGVDMVLVTHTHEDHFDHVARQNIKKDMQIFCQPPDEKKFVDWGFNNIVVIQDQAQWEGIHILRTGGAHGSGEILKHMGQVSGFILQADSEPTLYIIGDSIWVEEVRHLLELYKPEIVITNSGGAFIPGFESTLILMNEEETIKVAQAVNESKVIAVHMEALDHCTVNRASLKAKAALAGINSDNLLVPIDGEVIELT